jgi:hypothetical protein
LEKVAFRICHISLHSGAISESSLPNNAMHLKGILRYSYFQNMKTTSICHRLSGMFIAAAVVGVLHPGETRADTTVFFDSSHTTNHVSSGTTSDTISSEGYLFTVTRDKLFTGGVGLTNPIGRFLRVHWPDGLEAQAVTAGPNPSGARITIKRQNGEPFDIPSFTFQLLANTAGAGASLEIMPMLNGEDAYPDPLVYDATGYAGSRFTNNTAQLSGFDAYKVSLYVDFALMRLSVVDASPPRPSLDLVQLDVATLQLSWSTSAVGYVLESTTNLPAQAWSPVTNSIVTNGEFFSVSVKITGSKQFYRLRK